MTLPEKEIDIRVATLSDAEEIAEIYNFYIDHTIITFEEQTVTSSEIKRRLQEIQSLSLPWLVAEKKDEILGYAYASKWKRRCAYRFSTEVTVYIHTEHNGQGIGSLLYGELLTALKKSKIHAAIGGIALPNDASVALHEKFGFTKTAHFREVGFKFDRWIDVGYWQLIL